MNKKDVTKLDNNSFQKLKAIKTEKLNTYVYVDYENITKLLKKYGVTPIQINFFGKTREHLENFGFNIIDFLVYANFDDGQFTKGKCQTELQALGLQTRHTSNKGKNSGDLELTVDSLNVLYKNPFADAFVIISCDRDFIPLIKAIKSENKISYVVSTKIGFNKIVATYADFHEYIENIFDEYIHVDNNIIVENGEESLEDDLNDIIKVCDFFYKSDLYKNKVPQIKYNSFSSSVSKALSIKTAQVKQLFKKAHELKYISIYQGDRNILCLGDGERKDEIIA